MNITRRGFIRGLLAVPVAIIAAASVKGAEAIPLAKGSMGRVLGVTIHHQLKRFKRFTPTIGPNYGEISSKAAKEWGNAAFAKYRQNSAIKLTEKAPGKWAGTDADGNRVGVIIKQPAEALANLHPSDIDPKTEYRRYWIERLLSIRKG